MEEHPVIYLINDPAKGGKGGGSMAKRKVPKGFGSWRAYMAHIRGFRKTKGGGKARKARKTYSRNDPGPAPRRPVSRRRRYTRNPVHSIPARLLGGVIDAAELLVGKGAARALPTVFGVDRESTTGLIVQAAVGAAAGIGASYISANAGKMVLAGGFSAPMESLIKRANIPYVSAAFGDDESFPVTSIGAFPAPEVDMSAYPEGMGDDDGEGAFYQQ